MARVGIVHGSGTFESGDLTGFWWTGSSNKPEVVSSPGHPTRAGTYSCRCLVDESASPKNYRTEIMVSGDDTSAEGDNSTKFEMVIGNEYWIGFSLYIHDDWIPQVTNAGMTDVILNIQSVPDGGEIWRASCLDIRTDTVTAGNRWEITSRWDYGGYTEGWDGRADYNVPFDNAIGQWTDFVINVKWNATNDANGFLKIWINGNLEVDRTGPNCSNDNRGPQVQAGAYIWYFKNGYEAYINQFIRIYYLDEFRIGNDTSSYNDVMPGDQGTSTSSSTTSTSTTSTSTTSTSLSMTSTSLSTTSTSLSTTSTSTTSTSLSTTSTSLSTTSTSTTSTSLSTSTSVTTSTSISTTSTSITSTSTSLTTTSTSTTSTSSTTTLRLIFHLRGDVILSARYVERA